MNKERIKSKTNYLKNKIESDLERLNGIEEFNKYPCAPEVITSWISELISIIEEMEE